MRDLSVLIKPASGLCNLRCKYCFYNSTIDSRSDGMRDIMEHSVLEIIVRRAMEEAHRSVSFIFQGGEPLIAGIEYYRAFAGLIRRHNTKKLKLNLSIQTNGLLIDDAFAELFRKNDFLVGLSLDGYADINDLYRTDGQKKGSYTRIMRAANVLNRHQVQYNILCTVTNATARHADKLWSFYIKNGYSYLQFTPCISSADTGDTEFLSAESYASFYKRIFELWYDDLLRGRYISIRHIDNLVRAYMGHPPEICSMQGHCSCQFAIESDGSCYPCDFYMTDDRLLGNIAQMGFAELQSSQSARDFIESSRHDRGECSQCHWSRLCAGGCIREHTAGKYKFCEANREYFAHISDKLPQVARIVANSSR